MDSINGSGINQAVPPSQRETNGRLNLILPLELLLLLPLRLLLFLLLFLLLLLLL